MSINYIESLKKELEEHIYSPNNPNSRSFKKSHTNIESINSEYLNLYTNFDNKTLALVFSSLHAKLVHLLEIMNEKLPTDNFYNYYPAAPSREFIYIIEKIEGLFEALKESSLAFEIDSYYLEIIKNLKKILRNKAGSSIQRHTDKITIYYDKSIFIKKDPS